MPKSTKPGLPPGEEERYREFIARQQRLHREKVARQSSKPHVARYDTTRAKARALQRQRRLQRIKVAEAVGFCIVALLLGFFYWYMRPANQVVEQDPAQIQWAKGEGIPLEIVNSIGMRLRLVPAGSFTMGSAKSEPGHKADETEHKRHIPYSFYMAVTETTHAQYEEVMDDDPSFFQGSSQMPVDSVLWDEAVVFCNELSRREGLEQVYEKTEDGWVCHIERDGYRLPTEAEWEYACRAGTMTAIYTGSVQPLSRKKTNLRRIAWFHRNARGHPHDVAQKEANQWGFYDMLGNVREWCWDYYGSYPVTREPKLLGPDEGEGRVVRGGCWFAEPGRCRAAARRRWDPYTRWNSVGFRCVRTARQPELSE